MPIAPGMIEPIPSLGNEALYTTDELADLLSITERRARKLCREGHIEAYWRQMWVVPVSAVDRYLETHPLAVFCPLAGNHVVVEVGGTVAVGRLELVDSAYGYYVRFVGCAHWFDGWFLVRLTGQPITQCPIEGI
jgi:helix-turn-helix protein